MSGDDKESRISDKDRDVRFVDIHNNPQFGIGAVWALEQSPYAAGIGIFLALYTSAEFLTASVLARLLGIPESEALALIDNLNGYAPRLDRIERLAEERAPSNLEFYRRFVSEMRWFNQERNNCVHAHFALGQDSGKIYRAVGATERRKPTQWEVFPLDRLGADILRARKLIGFVWENMRTDAPDRVLTG